MRSVDREELVGALLDLASLDLWPTSPATLNIQACSGQKKQYLRKILIKGLASLRTYTTRKRRVPYDRISRINTSPHHNGFY
jgi:hypothetical protein